MTGSRAVPRIRGSRRFIALATLFVFGHAVALHLTHTHKLLGAPQANTVSSIAAVSTPHHSPAGDQHSGEHCLACQLQHGFAFLAAAPLPLIAASDVGTAPTALAQLSLRWLASNTTRGRAPPLV